MDEWLWMCSLPGFYRKDLERLLQFFETPDRVWSARDSQIAVLPFLKEKQKEILKEWKRKKPSQIRYKTAEMEAEQTERKASVRSITEADSDPFHTGNEYNHRPPENQ